MIKFRPNEKLPSTEAVNNFEKLLSCHLPKDYKNFLLQFNGGRLYKYYEIYIPKIKETFLISQLSSLNCGDIDLVCLLDFNRDDLSNKYIVIAPDGAGNNYLLRLVDGVIIYWDRCKSFGDVFDEETDGEGDIPEDYMYSIASSFTDFITNICKPHDVEFSISPPN